MRFQNVLCMLAASAVVLARSPKHIERMLGRSIERPIDKLQARAAAPQYQTPKPRPPKHLNGKTRKFYVDGTKIPDVEFDIGESYAGLLPISSHHNESRQLYFWYFPSANPLAKNEITIWLNGGPGCSSLEGFLQENGPFQWQYGTYKPVPNPWTWQNLTNMIWVEQPVGTGFSQGVPQATTEEDVAKEFMGFFKNFVKTFDLERSKVYISGESYAGMYVPHIASAMLDAKDKTYYNVQGTLIYDPSVNTDAITEQIPAVTFVDHHANLFAFNQTFMDYLHAQDKKCGYKDFLDNYLVFPPKGPLPTPPSYDSVPEGCDLFSAIIDAAQLVNPCWDIYQVATTCPLLWDVLGYPGSFTYLPHGAKIYFDRPEVKRAINAPDVKWEECSSDNVFNTTNGLSENANNHQYSGLTVLPGVIERSKRTVIAHGLLDFVLLNNGTLLTIQNMTWNGQQGFSKPITEDFFVPYHVEHQDSTLAGAGIMGKTRTERGLTYVDITLAGHMGPQYAPSAAYRHMEYLLGRVESLSSRQPFTFYDNGLTGLPQAPQKKAARYGE